MMVTTAGILLVEDDDSSLLRLQLQIAENEDEFPGLVAGKAEEVQLQHLNGNAYTVVE